MSSAIANVAIILISLLPFPKSNAGDGFTTDLIHRDSPQSPSYDPSLTPSQLITNAILRSSHRVRRFNSIKPSQNSPESDLLNAGGEFLVRYSIGSPPVPALGIVDTGSDLTWTQCKPCFECFNQTVPLFDPRNSSTFKKIRCDTPACEFFRMEPCRKGMKRCSYRVGYGDGSYSRGDLSRDTITFEGKSVISIRKVVIGCGIQNGGIFSGKESGVFGLGGGNLSMVHQLGPLAAGKFSYCLVPYSDQSNSSKLSFGANAVVSGEGAVSTKMATLNGINTFYSTTLLGISVGNQRLGGVNITSNILVDSGTAVTVLPTGLYNELKSAMEKAIKLRKVADPTNSSLDLCFETRDEVVIPEMKVHFEGGDLKWNAENVIARMSDDVVCLAALPTDDVAIYGNFAQANFLVGFDLVKRTVSFKPTDCGKL